MKRAIGFFAAAGLAMIFTGGCASNAPTGDSTTQDSVALPPVTTHYVMLHVRAPVLGISSKAHLTLTARIAPFDPMPTYKYALDARVNGNYFLMPDPPKIYTVVKTPYFKTQSRLMQFRVEIYNHSDLAMPPGRAIAAIDVNGKTISEKDILLPAILPEHQAEVTIDGPGPEAAGNLPAEGILRFGLYQVHVGEHVENYWWDAGYELTQRTETLPVTVVVRTPDEQAARQTLRKLQGQPPEEGN